MRQFSVLNKSRKPIGYLDVAALKQKWEAGDADPVRAPALFVHHSLSIIRKLTSVRTERKGILIHEQVPTIGFDTLRSHHAVDAFG